jgi:hypothetical protein
MKELNHKDVWTLICSGLTVEVVHFAVGNPNLNRGNGIWNYYVYINEHKTPHFDKLWLKDRRVRFSPQSPERITHDYFNLPLVNDAGWHGGITYYAKHGHSKGHRCIQIGCDFNHLWDEERGWDYALEDVLFEAMNTARLLAIVLGVKQD